MSVALAGASVLVTGASSGIGAALAVTLAERGARVGIVGRRADRLEAVAARCRDLGAECTTWVQDLGDLEAAQALALEAWDRFGHLDVLVDNATQDQVKPDFSLLIYPVISFDPDIMHQGTRNNLIGANASDEQTTYYSNETQVTEDMSPVCLVHASNDTSVKVENSLVLLEALRAKRVPAELTILNQGGHGFGLRPGRPMNRWFKSVESFLIGHNIIDY
ncbi:MAG: SDR family NAD(P)-dependent oxidoreductase [Planctomycetes bacterium]|nr:SDR family NAD(P)-dependent oxidoreductase [Planctomycetota bacterium]